ncbi:MAG: metal-sulfur cluster biosynthetic enzyme [Myxococcales bacterium]|nr:metal-sulfur cluster biosynthetic enzyme [Myxococcales bacterium]|tara:strand:- start:2001 stop:2339 length:339 start_codon:yes stop_codon:yes gene_type:complete
MSSNSPSLPTASDLKSSLNEVIDPELDVGLVDLGLIYTVTVDEDHADITMTWTSYACPYGPQLVAAVRSHGLNAGFPRCDVHVTFTPPWNPRTMATLEGKMKLGMWDDMDTD